MHEAFSHVSERILVHTELIKLKTDAGDLQGQDRLFIPNRYSGTHARSHSIRAIKPSVEIKPPNCCTYAILRGIIIRDNQNICIQ